MDALTGFLPGLREGRELTEPEAERAVSLLLDEAVCDADRALFLTALAEKGETGGELASFARALLPHAAPFPPLDFPVSGPLLDCCGTGGGGYPLFNVSTAVLFIAAAAGVPVVKHGNRGITKPSGSADVITALGLKAELTPQEAVSSLRELGFAFLHASTFHPAFRCLAAVRQELGAQGKRTIFNLLGPLLNPARPGARLVGVFRKEHVPLYAAALRELGVPRFAVAYGAAGAQPLGEISSSDSAANLIEGTVPLAMPVFRMEAFDPSFLAPLQVKNAAESAALIERLFRGEDLEEIGFGYSLLSFNAGAALAVQGAAESFIDGVVRARYILTSGAALQKLEEARAWSRGR